MLLSLWNFIREICCSYSNCLQFTCVFGPQARFCRRYICSIRSVLLKDAMYVMH